MYSKEEICKAVEAVNSGRLSLREAAGLYNISKSTIVRKRNDPVVEVSRRPKKTRNSVRLQPK